MTEDSAAKVVRKSQMPDTKLPPSRIIIDSISPDLSGGRFAAKRAQGEMMEVRAVIICDGHDHIKADILYRHESERDWQRAPLHAKGNDLWSGSFKAERTGFYYFTVEAALDRYDSWRDGLLKKLAVREHGWVDFAAGYQLIGEISHKLAFEHDKSYVHEKLSFFRELSRPFCEGQWSEDSVQAVHDLLFDPHMDFVLRWVWNDQSTVRFERELPLQVDVKLANFSAWYEFFPRSRWKNIAEEGTLGDCAARIDYVADLGFDIVYFPPIHPVGHTFRKGINNALAAGPDDPGSPWAIGSQEGGHKSIHPALGNFDDFAHVVERAQARGLKIALDIAFQCAPDHPYVREHPEWFKKRADGSIQYAENPPKKYQDIVPFDFECEDWKNLWLELKSVLDFWIEKGVRVFRVDNPHTKTFPFWEWVIQSIRAENHDIIFLAEAFTRPAVMAYLGKIGFNQSYTYFTWRDSKHEIATYMTELTKSEWLDFYRPNFWPNTPDILPAHLQRGGRAASMARIILAGTLSSNYGIYGPVYELLETQPLVSGKEEYMHSEKYEAREWDVDKPYSIAPLIRDLNRIRRENPALQSNHSIMFHPVENEQIIAYTKMDEESGNIILCVVNLDYYQQQAGMVDLQIQKLGISPDRPFVLEDQLSGARYHWQGWRHFVQLNPHIMPAHVFRVWQEEEILTN
jgi:starch synthase (maltosyl-transferring)